MLATQQEYLSIDEAAELLGWNRATVYEWMKTLGMKPQRFVRNRKAYLSADDIARLQEVKEKPWKADEYIGQRKQQVAASSLINDPRKIDLMAKGIAKKVVAKFGDAVSKEDVFTIVREELLQELQQLANADNE